MLLLIAVVVTWGISPNISKILLGAYSPAIYTAATAFVGFVGVLCVCAKKLKKLNKWYFIVGVPTGVFYSAACILQRIGLTSTTPTMYSFLENLSCLVVPFLVWIMTKKRPKIWKFMGAVICLVSVYILGNGKLSGSFGIGNILCGLAGIFYGVNMAVTGCKAKKLDPALYLLVQFGVHMIISTIYALLFEKIVFSFELKHIAIVIGLTLVSTVLGWIIRTICLTHLDPSLVSVIMPFSSVVTAIISVSIGQDALTAYLIIGAILGVIAAIVSDFDPAKFKKKKESASIKEGERTASGNGE